MLSTGKKQLASRFNLTYRKSDDTLSINNTEIENYLGQMYPADLEIKDTTESTTSASYLDLLLSIGRDGQLHTFIYDKRDDFNFHITNFPFMSSNNIIFAGLWRFYLSTYTIRPDLLIVWMFYSEGQATFQQATQRGIPRGTLEIVIQDPGNFMVDTGILFSNMKSPSRMLNDILTHDQQLFLSLSEFPLISWPW